MKRVAICISGQYRTFDKIWIDNLKILKKTKNFKYDFFCFFWNKKGNTPRILEGQNKTWNSLFLDPFYYYPKNINQKVKKNEIRNILPNSVIKIAKISEKKILQKDGILNLLKTYPDNKKAAFNSFCMWKAIQSCNQMKIDFQQKKNIRYDYVVRIRPDWKLKKNPIDQFSKKKNEVLFFDSSSPKTNKRSYLSVTDVCFVAVERKMDIISNLYSSWIMEIKKKGWKKYCFGDPTQDFRLIAETVLFWFIRKKKINICLNTVSEHGYIYRLHYENKFSKKIFSYKLLLKQIFNIPKKVINSFI